MHIKPTDLLNQNTIVTFKGALAQSVEHAASVLDVMALIPVFLACSLLMGR